MKEIRSFTFPVILLFAVQLTGIFIFLSEKYESRAVIQIQPSTPLDQFSICNVETIRGFLERGDLDFEIRKLFDLEKDEGSTQKPLISRRFQESDQGNGIFTFKFRHKSPEVARDVVAAFLDGIERLWRTESEIRYKNVIVAEEMTMARSLEQLDRQLEEIPHFRETLASSTSPIFTRFFDGVSITYPNPEFERLIAERNKALRRLQEIRNILSKPLLASETTLRWVILARPMAARRPIWPSRQDMILLAFVNSLVWAIAFFFWRRFRMP